MLSDLLNACDWSKVHIVLALTGGGLSAYVMSLISWEHEDRDDPRWLQWLRRIGHTMTSVAMFYTVSYMADHNWQPWPPMILLVAGVNVTMIVRAIAIHVRVKRKGHFKGSPAAMSARRDIA